ncbi:MAG: photosynthetic complex assembly protein PuhC [Lamprobacter sp.]|uniref:photosynthetic complex assembly protein PuhC n=1 Tax=Lamprobacter sp. TaxID=3100796 RepID=UPI002B25D7A4|nr:photosynthetic complex assembly protein PuhC [Lamprobacter sp.]MEA3639156.1 photosynthetic complex assembly protein PuhC [Lamprobacter sp.]
MSDPFEGRPFPRGVLIGAALLIAFVIAAAAMVRLTGVGGVEMPFAPVVEARELVFEELGGGLTMATLPGPNGADRDAVVGLMESGVDGFAMGVMRGMVRDRNARDLPLDAPYQLALLEDGRLVFRDPSVGTEIDLRAFGPTNMASFSKLLRAEPKPLADVVATDAGD